MALIDRIRSLFAVRQSTAYQRIVSAPAHLPSQGQILTTTLGLQLGGGALGALFLRLWGLSADLRPFPWEAALAVQVVMLAATAVWTWRLTAPIGGVARQLAQGVAPDAIPAALVRDALTIHRPMTAAMGLQWALGGPALVLVVTERLGFTLPVLTFTAVLTLLLGTVLSILVRYELLVRLGFPMTAALLPDGRLDRIADAPKERVYRHIIVLLVLMGGVQPISLFVMARDPLVSDGLLGLMALALIGVGTYVARKTLQLISLPVGYLESQMTLVREGRLDTHARLFSVDTFGVLNSDFNAMVEGLRQRERIRDIFGRYVTRQVAEEILSGRLELGGERRVVTILFADIQGFTALAERMPPEQVVALLNQYLGTMVTCVLQEGGVLDKFIGDAIMALFGVPVSTGSPAEDARAALRCALRMSERLDALNADRAVAGLPPIELGIGLHTGEVVAGNIGIPERMEYTVIGDSVNLSARLEGLTRTLRQRVLLSEETATLVGDLAPLVRVDTVSVRGRSQPVTVYTVRRAADPA